MTPSILHMAATQNLGVTQGRRKQSPDGQAQLNVGGEAVNNSRAKRAAKIWTLLFFSSEEALSLHFSFKLGF